MYIGNLLFLHLGSMMLCLSHKAWEGSSQWANGHFSTITCHSLARRQADQTHREVAPATGHIWSLSAREIHVKGMETHGLIIGCLLADIWPENWWHSIGWTSSYDRLMPIHCLEWSADKNILCESSADHLLAADRRSANAFPWHLWKTDRHQPSVSLLQEDNRPRPDWHLFQDFQIRHMLPASIYSPADLVHWLGTGWIVTEALEMAAPNLDDPTDVCWQCSQCWSWQGHKKLLKMPIQ